MVICSNYPTEAVKVIFAKMTFCFVPKSWTFNAETIHSIELKNQQITIFSYEF